MEIPLDKAIPRALALAVVAYCLWPSFVAYFSTPSPQQSKKTPELSAAMLSPDLAPSPTRDPFSQYTVSTAKEDSPTKKHKQTEAAKTRMDSKRSKDSASPVRLEAPIAGRADELKPMALEATCIVDDRRLAVINGRVYAPKDKLAMTKGTETLCEIVEVLPYKVLLKCENKIIELTFPDVPAKPATAAKRTSDGKTPPTAKRTARPKKRPAIQ